MCASNKLSISKRGQHMQGSPIRKLASLAENRKKQGIKVYYMNIGQPDLPSPQPVLDRIRSIDRSTIEYAPSNGLPEPLCAWKKYFLKHGIVYDESELIITTGGSEAIIFAMSAVCDADDEILVFEPFYTNYMQFACLANVKLKAAPLSIENGFHLPPKEVIVKYITEKTRAILISNPSNPTGTIYGREEIKILADIALEHNLFVLSDEAYREFAYEKKSISIADFPEIQDRAILFDSCSKKFNVCGARVGVLASHNKEIVATALKFAQARLSVATVEQLAVIPLLENSELYSKPFVEEFKRRRNLVCEELKKISGVVSYLPEGAFYLIAGLPVNNAEHFSKWLIEEFEYNKETVLVAPAQGFYMTPQKGINEVRLAFMLNLEDLKKALYVLRKALEIYKSSVQK